MKSTWRWIGTLAAPVALLVTSTASAESPAESAARLAFAGQPVSSRSLCDHGAKYHCLARVVTDPAGVAIHRPLAPTDEAVTAGFAGYGPADLASAYGLTAATATGGAGKTVAIIDAYDWKTAESDLASYRSKYGLPACTSASGCFKKISANGTTTLPPEDGKGAGGWGGEIMLDLEMVSAICPACNILLVEPQSDSDNAGFAKAPATAKAAGAVAISNSYGSGEDASIATDKTFDLGAGVIITASAGDSGFGPEYPATSPFVIAVGGTNLLKNTTARGWGESLWAYDATDGSGTGSGCSQFAPQPAFQTAKLPADITCTKRMESDLSAVADPATGVAVVITSNGKLVQGTFGGTSASSPIIAALIVRLGLESLGTSLPWEHPTAFNDVASGGTNAPAGTNCGRECTDMAGYDGPTGWGTPNGVELAKISAGGGGTVADAGASTDAGGETSGTGGGSSGVDAGSDPGPSSGTSGTSGATPPATSAPPATPKGGATSRDPADGSNGSNGSAAACSTAMPGASSGGAAFALALAGLGLVASRRRRS